MIEEGKRVSIEYTVCMEGSAPLDSNVGKEPLVFSYGEQQILPNLERSLWGLEVGDCKEVILAPADAYGDVNPQAFKEVSVDMIPEDFRYEGAILVVSDEQFGEMVIRVAAVEEGRAILDFNHPLAGKELRFDIKILDVA